MDTHTHTHTHDTHTHTHIIPHILRLMEKQNACHMKTFYFYSEAWAGWLIPYLPYFLVQSALVAAPRYCVIASDAVL